MNLSAAVSTGIYNFPEDVEEVSFAEEVGWD